MGLIQNVNVNNSLHEHINCGSTLDNDITINNISISTPSSAANTDGIDPSGTNWLIENCTISDGDDDIAPKPESIACANIDIENCLILSGHGISVGGQTQAGLNGLTVNNVTFNGTTNGLRLKAGEGNGGLVQNLTYSNITMTNVGSPIIIDSYYNNGDNNFPSDPTSDKGSPPDSLTPIWKNITFLNFTSTDTSGNGGQIYGLPDEPVQNMTFTNVKITSKTGMIIDHVRNTSFDSTSHITQTSGNDLVGGSSSFPTPVDSQITLAGFTNQDIGSPTIPFDTSESLYDVDSTNWVINGGGAGITGTSDQFNFSSQSVSGNATVSAELTALSGGSTPQAGVMYRASTNANDPFAAVVQTTAGQIIFEWRATAGATVQTSAPVSVAVGSAFVRVVRSGSSFSGFYSTNGGSTYTQIGSTETISTIGTAANVGLAVSAHSNGSTAAATFSKLTISGTTTQGPTVATPASASPNPVTAKTTALSVLGADPAGEASLTYTWADTGPAGVTFSANGTNASKASTATFAAAGSYTFTVTIKDASGLTTTSSVAVTVNQTLTSIAVSPSTASVAVNGTQQFTASAKDQFGNSLTTQPTFTWSVVSGGVGTISTGGLYSAGATAGSATIHAVSGSVTGSASVTVSATNQAPTVATPASASPNPVTGKTTALSVLGADDGGEANLTYTWADTGPTGVTFSANGTNASKASTATFTQAGSYTFTVTIKDAGGLTTTSSVAVTVSQTLTSIVVTPATASINTGTTQQFAASAKDQFGNSLTTQPTFTWSVVSGGVGTISTSGLYTAGSTAGSATIHAVSGAVTGSASVTVTAASSTVKVNLSSSFNTIGFTTDGTTVAGTGLDGTGNTYSGTLIAASSLPSTFNFGTANVNNTVAASGQTIALTQGKFSTLTFLGAGINGAKAGKTFMVTYTDGTTTTFSVSLSNWHTQSNFAGETTALSMAYRDTVSGGRTTSNTFLYEYSLALNNTKTIASITLPNNTDTVAILAMDLNP